MNSLRKPFVAGNWKMHNSISESKSLAVAIRDGVTSIRDIEIAVAPSFTALRAVADVLEGSSVGVAGQDCHFEVKGAFTGAVAISQLRDAGCRYVIIGHSERRQFFAESDQSIAKKARALIDGGLTPILCIGELLEEREAGRTFDVVLGQLDKCLAEVRSAELGSIVVAYEPVWAIGTGKTATVEQAEEVHARIRRRLGERFGAIAESVRIQYGGSVKPDNAARLMEQENIDGALVGGASLQADAFTAIVSAARR
jgi:triosephosphate isomerase